MLNFKILGLDFKGEVKVCHVSKWEREREREGDFQFWDGEIEEVLQREWIPGFFWLQNFGDQKRNGRGVEGAKTNQFYEFGSFSIY